VQIEDKSGITPTGDLVLMLCPPIAATTASGIHIPEEARERQMKATRVGYFLKMGEQAALDPRMHGIAFGDLCLIPRYAADFVPIGGVEYLLLRAASVLGKLESMPDYQFQKAAEAPAKVFGVNQPPEASRIARLG
jgi:co-chaperonin GroES (HSP10)